MMHVHADKPLATRPEPQQNALDKRTNFPEHSKIPLFVLSVEVTMSFIACDFRRVLLTRKSYGYFGIWQVSFNPCEMADYVINGGKGWR